MKTDLWNTLEIFKLAAGFLTPLVLTIFGVYLHRVMKRYEHNQWRSQKLVEKRLQIYDEVAPRFNDLLCYFTYVGRWKFMSPESMIEMKGELDKIIYISAPLFSSEFFDDCMNFQSLCYEVYNGRGQGPKMKTNIEHRQQYWPGEWDHSWNNYFSEKISSQSDIVAAYHRVLSTMSRDIGVHKNAKIPVTGD